jgi:acyl carrier protein
MSSLEQRLLGCFQSVFAGEPAGRLATATPDSLGRWDSTNHFLLIEVIEEEFQVRIPERDSGELLSFQAWAGYLADRVR